MTDDPRRARTVAGLLVLASLTVLTLDAHHNSSGSPVDPMRSAVGTVFGPAEDAAAAALEPIINLPDHFADLGDLRDENARLQTANDELASQLNASGANAIRDSEVDGISRLADTSGFHVVPAQVIAMGAAQSFSRTVTIDAGTNKGVVPDLTVVNADGLVGRVIQASRSTASVLLIVDAESTIGGRLGGSLELGFLAGSGDLSADGTLEMSLLDETVAPRTGDAVVTWGSRNDAPYVAGVPVGRVVKVFSSPGELTQSAEIEPYADFSSLDVVAVVTGTTSGPRDRDLAEGGTP